MKTVPAISKLLIFLALGAVLAFPALGGIINPSGGGGGGGTPAPAGTPAVASTPVTGASTWTAPAGWSNGDAMMVDVFDSSGESGNPNSSITNANGGTLYWQYGASVTSNTDQLYNWVTLPGVASMAGAATASKNGGGSLLDSFVWDISCAASGGNVLVDQYQSTQGGTSTTQVCPTSTITTRYANELVVYYGHHLGAASSSPATGAGITAWGNSTTGSGASSFQSSAGSVVSVTFTSAASGSNWTCGTVTFYCSK